MSTSSPQAGRPQRDRDSEGVLVRVPSELWEEVERLVPEAERARFLELAVRDALMLRENSE